MGSDKRDHSPLKSFHFVMFVQVHISLTQEQQSILVNRTLYLRNNVYNIVTSARSY